MLDDAIYLVALSEECVYQLTGMIEWNCSDLNIKGLMKLDGYYLIIATGEIDWSSGLKNYIFSHAVLIYRGWDTFDKMFRKKRLLAIRK